MSHLTDKKTKQIFNISLGSLNIKKKCLSNYNNSIKLNKLIIFIKDNKLPKGNMTR